MLRIRGNMFLRKRFTAKELLDYEESTGGRIGHEAEVPVSGTGVPGSGTRVAGPGTGLSGSETVKSLEDNITKRQCWRSVCLFSLSRLQILSK